MANVRVFIPIRKGYHGESCLLETTFDMDFLPNEGDRIHPLKNDRDSGLTFSVKSRYWDERGKVNIEIGQHIIDPEDVPGEGTRLPRTWHSWSSDRDGDLVEMLLANGWEHYDPRKDS